MREETQKKYKYKTIEKDGKILQLRSTAVAYYDEKGEAHYKKKIPECNILTKRAGTDKVLFIVSFVILCIHCLSLFAPITWILISSFKESTEFLFPTSLFAAPKRWEFENYAEAFSMIEAEGTSFFGMFLNSIWYTALSTGIRVFCPVITAYVISKYQFMGRNLIYTIAITILTIPIIGTSGSALKLYGDLGIYDTPLYVILTAMSGFSGNFIVYYGFFKSVSWSYAEAAQMDGANPFVIFFRIMLPQAVSIMLVYAITMGIANWNDYQSMILYLPSYPTISSGLYVAGTNIDRFSRGDTPVYYAGIILSAIPPIIIFSLFSNKIMTSISVGGLKG